MGALRLLLALLGILLALANAVALRDCQNFPHPTAAVVLGLGLGELGLITSWAALARRSWMVRVAIAWAFAALAAWPLSQLSGPSWRAWAGMLLLFAIVVVIAWQALLATGLRLHAKTSTLSERPPLGPRQCSLSSMLQVITACALALGISSWLKLPERDPVLAVMSILTLASSVPLTISAFIAETPRLWMRGALLLIVPAGAANFALLYDTPTALFLTLALTVQTLVMLVAAIILSVGGVSLQPVTESTTPRVPEPPSRLGDAL
jgi:hypothetical protein